MEKSYVNAVHNFIFVPPSYVTWKGDIMNADEVLTPIIVEVRDGHYKAFSLGETLTQRDLLLMYILKCEGGVNISTPDGRYHFNAMLLNETTMEFGLSFDRIDD